MKGRVLVIAGSDSGGGAGIQADIKTITALDAFAMTAITALTAQNTLSVEGVWPVPEAFIKQQISVVLNDLGADCIKIGMVGDVPAIKAVLSSLPADTPIVLDPVMVAKGGHSLLAGQAVGMLRDQLLPRAAIVTPNLPEAEALIGQPIRTVEDMRQAAAKIASLGPGAVLLKGGHLDSDTITDILFTHGSAEAFSDARIPTIHTHGTGCTTASAIAAGLAQDLSLRDAVIRARRYVRAAIAAAPGYGRGHGPLNHAVTIDTSRLDTQT